MSNSRSSEAERILDEATEHFGIADARCMHRIGQLAVGDTAVWIGVVTPHRDEAFRACRYIIDQIKLRLPIWKKEHYLEGESAWVACAHGGRRRRPRPRPSPRARQSRGAKVTGPPAVANASWKACSCGACSMRVARGSA